MNTFFECTVKYTKMDENGHERKATETYMIDAISCTEAESRIYKELEKMISGEFRVPRISLSQVSEIIPSEDGDRWYKAKLSFVTIDEEKGKEKRIAQQVLVFANDAKEAYDNIIEAMQGMMADFEIVAISESKILDVFPYSEENTRDIKSEICNGNQELICELCEDKILGCKHNTSTFQCEGSRCEEATRLFEDEMPDI